MCILNNKKKKERKEEENEKEKKRNVYLREQSYNTDAQRGAGIVYEELNNRPIVIGRDV